MDAPSDGIVLWRSDISRGHTREEDPWKKLRRAGFGKARFPGSWRESRRRPCFSPKAVAWPVFGVFCTVAAPYRCNGILNNGALLNKENRRIRACRQPGATGLCEPFVKRQKKEPARPHIVCPFVAVETSATSMQSFRQGRDIKAWLGLVPRRHSSGGKQKLGRTSKMGQRDIRREDGTEARRESGSRAWWRESRRCRWR